MEDVSVGSEQWPADAAERPEASADSVTTVHLPGGSVDAIEQGPGLLTGPALQQHRQARQTEAYDPKEEAQFNADAKDLMEWELQENLAAPNTDEQKRVMAKKQAILDAYRELGRKSHQRPEPAQNYPYSNNSKFAPAIQKLKDAYREGFNQTQSQSTPPPMAASDSSPPPLAPPDEAPPTGPGSARVGGPKPPEKPLARSLRLPYEGLQKRSEEAGQPAPGATGTEDNLTTPFVQAEQLLNSGILTPEDAVKVKTFLQLSSGAARRQLSQIVRKYRENNQFG